MLRMNLQNFADGLLDFEDDNTDSDDLDLTNEDYDIEEQTGPEFGDVEEEPANDEPDKGSDEPEVKPPTPDPVVPVVPEVVKPVQTPEQNAHFAEQRRQAALQAEVERVRTQSPEYQLAQTMAALYDTTPDILLERARAATLEKQSKATGLPVEYIQAQQAQAQQIEQLKMQLATNEFQGWQNRIEAEAVSIKASYAMLSDDDIEAAKGYLLNGLKDVNAPLENAIYALHGSKISAAIREQARQEALAEISGRKPGPVNMSGGKTTSSAEALTAEERYVAKQMGISEAEYIKNKV